MFLWAAAGWIRSYIILDEFSSPSFQREAAKIISAVTTLLKRAYPTKSTFLAVKYSGCEAPCLDVKRQPQKELALQELILSFVWVQSQILADLSLFNTSLVSFTEVKGCYPPTLHPVFSESETFCLTCILRTFVSLSEAGFPQILKKPWVLSI